MENNVIKTPHGTAIINGGNPLEGCPVDWDEAKLIQDKLNEGKDPKEEPVWRFDCGFKLDFDGPILTVGSRFYPPKTHYGPTWGGTVTIYLLGTEIDKKFNCKTLDELKTEVENYIQSLKAKISTVLTP